MPREIPKAYEPQEIEQRWARAWFEEKLFRPETSGGEPNFSIVLPPPNVTGSIHIGHMLEHTLIDTLVRWHRMRGERTLWLPGMDHAGIATQFVVERQLATQGLKRQELGREEFERRVWKWKAESGGVIKEQMIRLGVSCDWTREHFTLEPALYRAVLEAFLRLYGEGLIYRGRYMVNWCPRCQTAISDLETVHVERAGKLWHIRYPIAGSKDFLVVATTRPETMLGDTAVAVHPDDERYAHVVGKKVRLPLMNREIPVIADSYVDREFGTGVLKITPAHDTNDFEVGKRHHLPEIDVMTNDGHMSPAAGPYAGMDRFAAREKIVADLSAQGLLDRVENHTHSVGTCDRCKTDIEPRVSTQWFCKMKPLAVPATQVVLDGLIEVNPDNQRTILLNWLDNIRDWCISRQLWWGHRIPIWHCAKCQAMTPALDSRVEIVDGHARAASPPKSCGQCGSAEMTQDPDVLDTWFSSALWPFSTLGWPDETPDLHAFYPTSVLISGYDILFFWDVRMIMMGLHLMPRPKIEERIPFRRLHLHSLVRTAEGAKMSKTRGNVVDPLEVIEKHGTDALRFALMVMASPGTDIALSEERILGSRAFANKIWNAARFLFMNFEKSKEQGLNEQELKLLPIGSGPLWKWNLPLIHSWIFSRLSRALAQYDDALQNFRFHEAAQTAYEFFWGDFCDWYIEWVKPDLVNAKDPNLENTWANILGVFQASLKMLHPIMPFITEELWHRFEWQPDLPSMAFAKFPDFGAALVDDAAEQEMSVLQDIIGAARNIRAELKLDPKQKISAEFSAVDSETTELARANLNSILRLAALSSLDLRIGHLDPAGGAVRSTAKFDLRIAHGEGVDKQAESAKLKKEIERLAKDVASKQTRLADETFRSRAPAEIVRGLEATLAERQAEYEKLRERLAQLE
ncbi:MAG TPA: valine--tRNA ligase [Candidatus Acidoferrales bacterium]|jgi:valyl-tRNA synthetase|nr:valine--tRNA ligase [Candidatus Acidoferrales bacterium]